MEIKVKRLREAVKFPEYKSDGAAGADLCAELGGPEWLRRIYPGEVVAIPTGLIFEIPPGFEAQIRTRSGLAVKKQVVVLNSPGTIDSDYRGEVQVLLINLGAYPCDITHGDRIAQLVIAPVVQALFVDSKQLTETVRGAGSFGSTGVK